MSDQNHTKNLRQLKRNLSRAKKDPDYAQRMGLTYLEQQVAHNQANAPAPVPDMTLVPTDILQDALENADSSKQKYDLPYFTKTGVPYSEWNPFRLLAQCNGAGVWLWSKLYEEYHYETNLCSFTSTGLTVAEKKQFTRGKAQLIKVGLIKKVNKQQYPKLEGDFILNPHAIMPRKPEWYIQAVVYWENMQ